MSILPADVQSLFADFVEVVYNGEQSSDDGSASNSDAEPELQDSEPDEFVTYETVENTISRSQIASTRNWQETPPNNIDTISPNLSCKCSLTTKSQHVETIEDCFHLFIDEEIIDSIILHTNEKAKNMLPNQKWKPVDRIEIDAFFGLLLLIGRFRESEECTHDLWKENQALSRRFYAAVMSRDRFLSILKYICFDDPATRKERKCNDKLAPIRQITNIFTQNCKDSYNATGTGCLGQQLVPFRGHCSFKVNMASKGGRYGIKTWTLCDSNTFYCCNMDIYLGKHENTSDEQQGEHVVKQMTNMWKNSGRCVTTDDFFTDLSLAEDLLENKIFFVGTVHKNAQDVPKTLTETRNRSQYSSQFLFTDKLTLVSYLPKPRKSIVLVSTLHHEHSVSTAAEKFKPHIINYYNSTKTGVDGLEKVIQEHSCRRCTHRWPLALFMHYMDIAAYNAFVIWHTKNSTWENRNSLKVKRTIFLEELSKKLTAKNIDRRAAEFENKKVGLHKNVINAIEATGRKIVKKPKLGNQKRTRCCFCIGSNNKYSTVCDNCERHVCHAHSIQIRSVICNTCNTIQ